MSGKLFVTVIAIIAFLINITACGKDNTPKKISLEKKSLISPDDANLEKKPLRIAVGGMITPKEGLVYYKHFLDYIGEKTGEHVHFVDRDNYSEINALLKKGDIDAAFVCSGPYVDGIKDSGLELLVVPEVNGKTVYYSYIISAKNSPINNFDELRGKSFAFTDPLSNTGKLVPTFMLAEMNETPNTFFKNYIFTKSHDKAIKAVAQGIVDGAAVDSLIWEYLNARDPEFTSKTKIIKISEPFAIPPVVVTPGIDPKIKAKLRKIFLNAHYDEKGRELLKKMMIDKFIVIDDKAYDSIRKIKSWLAGQNGKRQK